MTFFTTENNLVQALPPPTQIKSGRLNTKCVNVKLFLLLITNVLITSCSCCFQYVSFGTMEAIAAAHVIALRPTLKRVWHLTAPVCVRVGGLAPIAQMI